MAAAVETSPQQSSIETWIGIALVAFAFLTPVETLLPIKLFRVTDAAVFAAWLYTIIRLRPFPSPISLRIAAGAGIASVVVSLLFAAERLTALETGLLEVAALFVLIHVYSAWGTKETLIRSMGAFVFGTAILSACQIVSLYPAFPRGTPPFSASMFMAVKDNVGVVQRALTIGNSDNFATLWSLAFPLSVGLVWLRRYRWPMLVCAIVIGYSGLLLFSRAAILTSLIATLALICSSAVQRRFNLPAILAAVALLAVAFDPKSLPYYMNGVDSFVSAISHEAAPPHQEAQPSLPLATSTSVPKPAPKPAPVPIVPAPEKPPVVAPIASPSVPPKPAAAPKPSPAPIIHARVAHAQTDNSGSDRATAFLTGWKVATSHPLTGIGFGLYPTGDPTLTSPHSAILMWFSEGGILGLVTFLMLCVFVLWRWMRPFGSGEPLPFICATAAASMLIKCALFGGAFAVSSNFVWSLGLALMIATICRYDGAESVE